MRTCAFAPFFSIRSVDAGTALEKIDVTLLLLLLLGLLRLLLLLLLLSPFLTLQTNHLRKVKFAVHICLHSLVRATSAFVCYPFCALGHKALLT
jgi:hypothetical protein